MCCCLCLGFLLKAEPGMRTWAQKVYLGVITGSRSEEGVWRMRQGGRKANRGFTSELVTAVGDPQGTV